MDTEVGISPHAITPLVTISATPENAMLPLAQEKPVEKSRG